MFRCTYIIFREPYTSSLLQFVTLIICVPWR